MSDLSVFGIQQPELIKFGVIDEVNTPLLLDIIDDYNALRGSINDGYAEITFDCSFSAEEAIYAYKNATGKIPPRNPAFFIGIENGDNDVFLHIARNLGPYEMEFDETYSRAYFTDLDTVKAFIAVYNEMTEIEEEVIGVEASPGVE